MIYSIRFETSSILNCAFAPKNSAGLKEREEDGLRPEFLPYFCLNLD